MTIQPQFRIRKIQGQSASSIEREFTLNEFTGVSSNPTDLIVNGTIDAYTNSSFSSDDYITICVNIDDSGDKTIIIMQLHNSQLNQTYYDTS